MAFTLPHNCAIFCPSCGDRLDSCEIDGRSLPRCADCDLTLYQNPTPMARATVVDETQALLIERGRGADIGEWALAGGHIEHDESPPVAAARELEEETGITVPPTDLTLIGDGFLDFGNGVTMVSFNYAAQTSAASGTVQADDDAADARYWSRQELVSETPLLRASGLDQVLTAMDDLT